MNIWNGIESFPDGSSPVVATIGNYDGVHLGHQTIVRRVLEAAGERGQRALLLTFSPHPLSVVSSAHTPRMLQTRGQKLESLRQSGLTDVLILEFNAALAALSGEDFFGRMLEGRLTLSAIHVGDNFRFGNRRHGDLSLLRRIGETRGFEVVGVDPIKVDDETVSSTAIRKALDEGRVERARRMLGRPFEIRGEVVPGDGRGRELGFPTANLDSFNEVLPRPGVYVTETVLLASRFPSVTNVGVRPTFGGQATTVETHLLGFDGDLYYERGSIHFLARLREEERFDNASDLADQIARDRAAAEAFFQNRPLGAP